MQIVLNEKNEIMSFTLIGEINDSKSREYDGELPDDFVEEFKPGAYLLDDNNVIAKNPDYVAPEPPVIGPSQQDKINAQIMLTQAKQKEEQDKFNAQILLKLAGGTK